MENFEFLDDYGSFRLENAQRHTGMYFPIAGEFGMKSAVTPDLSGDAKLDQNHFLMEPVSVDNLHNNRSTRNFWCTIEGQGVWSATGHFAGQMADKFSEDEEPVTVSAGYMWHKTKRHSAKLGIASEITSFVPIQKNMEIHIVKLTNQSDKAMTVTPVAAVPIYGRSADNIRDHRHVTSLLHRISVFDGGVCVNPTLSFDERGHKLNDTIYFVAGMDEQGEKPVEYYPTLSDFIGEGGNLEMPEAIIRGTAGVGSGYEICGKEAFGGIKFNTFTLEKGESKSFVIYMGISHKMDEIDQALADYTTLGDVTAEYERTIQYWRNKVNVRYKTKDENFNQFMNWVSFQPELRRVFGCSFLPHHDYGKGGRGWRDLWQDCLALLIMNPGGVRQMLLGNFGGVRVDGSNATIIGAHIGEFKADRNSIARVWMDHGVWPLITTKLYIDQTGDIDILNENVRYFKDAQIKRGTAVDALYKGENTFQLDSRGQVYNGSVLEHLLLQNLTSFWDVGEHNHIRLRGADWNDALDMANDRGESVAFTNAYAKNLLDLADLIEELEKRGQQEFLLMKEIEILLQDAASLYDDVDRKKELLNEYMEACRHNVSGIKVTLSWEELVNNLRNKGNWILENIRENEWIEADGCGWFNGYYDNSGRALEGYAADRCDMMLTSQVFSIMCGTATDEQVMQIAKAADRYLYDRDCGGYRLNTDFKEIKTDMGRMFGFAYGEKENGAVFSHMAVMYGNALYRRGFVKEGYKALSSLYRQSMDFEKSHIYPGIPEYFGQDGRGLYHYLTGAASWYMMTAVNEMFGVRGSLGNLFVEPKLLKEQFDESGTAAISLKFRNRSFDVEMENLKLLEYGEYKITEAILDGGRVAVSDNGRSAVVPENVIAELDERITHKLKLVLR